MADSLSTSMGGRVASIYKQNTKRRRFTSVMNDIETKRLKFLKKQIEYDRVVEKNKLDRGNEKATNANDELKAFQVALLRRIGIVKEESKMTMNTRPLLNLGKYGGATVDQIKAESEKYKRIRDPVKRRMIKAKIYLEQGKRDGRITNMDPDTAGKLAENILQLYKTGPVDLPVLPKIASNDVANLNDVTEADELCELDRRLSSSLEIDKSEENHKKSNPIRATYPPNKGNRRIILPPVQLYRSANPNSNYYRKISADYHKRKHSIGMSPIGHRRSILQDIAEEGDRKRNWQDSQEITNTTTGNTQSHSLKPPTNDNKFLVTSISHYASNSPKSHIHSANRRKYFEWDYTKPVENVKIGKHLKGDQRFWKQDTVPFKGATRRIVLPKIG